MAEGGRRLFTKWCDRHQTAQAQAGCPGHGLDEAGEVRLEHATTRRISVERHLHEHVEIATGRRRAGGQGRDESRPVDGMHHLGVRAHRARLVGLQPADEVPGERKVGARRCLGSPSWSRFSPMSDTPRSCRSRMSESGNDFVTATTTMPERCRPTASHAACTRASTAVRLAAISARRSACGRKRASGGVTPRARRHPRAVRSAAAAGGRTTPRLRTCSESRALQGSTAPSRGCTEWSCPWIPARCPGPACPVGPGRRPGTRATTSSCMAGGTS